jgi:hypothetical protein
MKLHPMSFVGLVLFAQVSLANPTHAQSAEHALNSYASALLSGDVAGIQAAFSKRVHEGIASRYGTLEKGIQSRLEQERNALLSAQTAAGVSELYRVKNVAANTDGSILAVEVTFAGADIEKNITLVLEEGAYRIDAIGTADVSLMSCPGNQDFRVNNTTSSTYSVACSSGLVAHVGCPGNSRNFAPRENSLISCPSWCGWVGGTRFHVSFYSFPIDCAYNLVGWDLNIGATLTCQNPC